jgi:ammonia channel protein AmtB
MFESITKNHTILVVLLILGITMGIVSIILGLTMTVTATMMSSFVLCFLAIIFIAFSGYNLMYHEKAQENFTLLKAHLQGGISSESPNNNVNTDGYFFYKN